MRALLDSGFADRSRAARLRRARRGRFSAIVMSLIQTGKIEAIVGVSCLSVLERAFPYMEAAAIPGVAVPLLQDDCIDTTVDLDWVWDYIHLTSDDRTRRLDLERAARRSRFLVHARFARSRSWAPPKARRRRSRANGWGAPANAGGRSSPSPLFRRCARRPGAPLPDDLRKVAVAVECFHKASLIHDDIEDDDAHALRRKNAARRARRRRRAERRRPAHRRRLSPASLRASVCAEQKAEMLRVAARRPARTLPRPGRGTCAGRASPQPLTSLQVLDIFRKQNRARLRSRAAARRALRRNRTARGSWRRARRLQRSARHRLPDSR